MQNQWRVLFLVFIATEHLATLFKQGLMVDIYASTNSLKMRVKLYAWIGDFYRKLFKHCCFFLYLNQRYVVV